jgi:hypothetical protein
MPSRRTRRAAATAVGLSTLLAVSTPAARALDFTFSPAAGTPQEVIDAFTLAGQRWSAIFEDPVRIRIDIEYTSLGTTSLAETVNYYHDLSWSTVRSRLVTDASSADDALAVQSLPSSGGIPILINRTSNSPTGSGSLTPYLDNDGDANNTTIRTPTSIQRALGLSGVGAGDDAIITFSSDFQWDFDPTDGIASNRYDFVGIATHEIGHALGVLSGVDTVDAATTPLRDDQYSAVTPMDLFRVSVQSKSLGAIDFTADSRDKFFSIGDLTDVPLATGANHGDGDQASHWKDDSNSGIFDPSFAKGELLTISADDRRLLDVIGYNRAAAWSWAKPVSGEWGRALNWASASDLNDPATGARFDAPGAYTVTVNDVRDAHSVRVAAGAAVTLQGASGAARLRLAQDLTVEPNATLNLAGPSTFAARDVVNQGTFDHAAETTLEITHTFTNTVGVSTLRGNHVWHPGSALVVNSGTVNLQTSASPAGAGNVAVTVNNGGRLSLGASQRFQSLTMTAGTTTLSGGGNKVLTTSSLSVDPTATVDLNDNDMIIAAADASSRDAALAHVTEILGLARNSPQGLWKGTGITSSAAAGTPHRTLAAVANPGLSSFAGEEVGPHDVLIKYTWTGDMNIDGVVNADDYFRIDSGFLAGASGFANGDLNYDIRINADDYFLIDSSFLAQGNVSTSAFAMASVSIPEPRFFLLLALTAPLLFGRVRKPLR